jgi:hypothetical protein
MKTRVFGTALFYIILLASFVVLVFADVPAEPHTAEAMWVDPSSVTFSNSNASVGQKFNVTVWLNISVAQTAFSYQTALKYNHTQLKCTRAGFTAGAKSQFLSAHTTSGLITIDTSFLGNGSILASEASLDTAEPGPRADSLAWAEFEILKVPTAGNLTSKLNISGQYQPDGTGDTWVDRTGSFDYLDPLNCGDSLYTFIGPSGPPTPGPLSVTIAPSTATITVNQSQLFNSTASGGTPPYKYQWFLNGSSVPGANSNTWVFSSSTNGSYTTYVNVTDNLGLTANSNTGVVTVLAAGAKKHDVAVVEVVPLYTWVCQNRSVNINVTIMDKGDYDETVAVTLYYNVTANQMIGMQTNNTKTGENMTVTLSWNTTGVPYGYNYTIAAYANITSDSNPADNLMVDGEIQVRMQGDVNGDNKVDGKDLLEFLNAQVFGSYGPGFMYSGSPPSSKWNPMYDLSDSIDGKIDGKDLIAIARNFGRYFSP